VFVHGRMSRPRRVHAGMGRAERLPTVGFPGCPVETTVDDGNPALSTSDSAGGRSEIHLTQWPDVARVSPCRKCAHRT
jgi:hypothetical protein